MKKEELVKKDISDYNSSQGDYIVVSKLVKFLCKHLELKPEDLIEE